MNPRATHYTAIAMLVLTNLFWCISFPLVKAIALEHEQLLPGSPTWFITTMSVAPRFLLATAVLLLVAGRQLRGITRAELTQGGLLGVSAALGMLLQNDGLQFTEASTSAFLTQLYAVGIPLYLAARFRQWPPAIVWTAVVLVLSGVAVLARVSPANFHLGRGEVETLACSVFFMWQILVLEDRRFVGARVLPVTTVMFAVEAALFIGLAFATAPRAGDVLVPWTSGPWLGFTGLLTVFCTLGSFLLMNAWQPKISATEAGLIYCLEPVFTALVALFLPGMLSHWAGVDYANETVTWQLLAGGGLITLANVLVQLRPPPRVGPARGT